MAITGTGTGPFTITGTETTLSIYNAVVLANSINATKNSDNTQFDFNCALILGDRVIASSWTSTEEQIRIDATNFRIELNATFTMGIASPARAGGSLRVVCPGDAFRVNGTFLAYAARIYSQGRAKGDVGATIYFEECTLALLDSIEGQTTLAPNTTYVRCFIAGATAVAVKVQAPVSLTNTKVSGATYAFQVFGVGTKTITDYVGQSNANDFIPNQANAGITNVVGAFDGAGAPRTSLIIAGPNATFGSIFLKWRYNLSSLLSGSGTTGATVRIRNVSGVDVFTGTTAAGAIAQQTLTRFEYTNSATGITHFPYSVKVRKYEITSISLTYQADNHAQQTAAHVAVPFLTLTQSQAAALTGIALAPSGAAGGIITITSARTLSQLWQYYRAWISTLANYNSDDTWTFDGTTLIVGAWTVVGLENLSVGELVFSSATANGPILNLQIVGNVTQATPTPLIGVTIAGTLTYNTAANTNITYTNSTLGTVNNSGAGIVTVKRVNSTLTPGTNVQAYLPTTLVFSLNGGRIRVLNHLGVEQYNQTSDGTFELPAAATGTWSYKIAKYGSKAIEGTFAINGTTVSITPAYIPDSFVVDTLANVAAYTSLGTTQKIYDYYSYALTTASGILLTKSVTLTASILNLGAYTLSPGALGVTETVIGLNVATVAGLDIVTTANQNGVSPTYPQRITDSVATSTWINTTLAGGRIRILNQLGAEQFNTATDSITLLPKASTGTWTYKVVRYGSLPIFGSFDINGLAKILIPSYIPDAAVVAPLATVLAYTALETTQKIYDYYSYFLGTAPGMSVEKSVFLTAARLDLGSYQIQNSALGVVGNIIGINSATVSGVNILTTATQSGITPTFPQQLSDAVGSTNWLNITLAPGQVYLDSLTNSYNTASSITLLPATAAAAITIYVTKRGFKKQVISIPYSTNLLPAQAFTLIPDTSVADLISDLSTASFTSSQAIYDAFSQYQATAAGILDTYTPAKSPGAIDFNSKGFTLGAATNLAASPLQLKSTGLVADTYYSAQAFTQGAATLANSVLIRALNLNSEIVFTPDSITFYPTQSDRNAGTNAGVTATGGVIRFLHGSTVSGVVMSGTLYLRVTVGAIVFFADLPIISGANIMDLGVQGQLSAISAKVDQVPSLVWEQPLDGTIQAKRLLATTAATLAGKATGGGTDTITFRNLSDTATAATMTVDLNGNRSAVTITP